MAKRNMLSMSAGGGMPSIDWQAVLSEHGRWLRTVILARVGNPRAVEEVFQDVARVVVSKGDRLRKRTKLAPWLYRLAVGVASQSRRRVGRCHELSERFATQFRPAEQDTRYTDPLLWLVAKEERGLLRLALKGLARRDAEILLLQYTENWSYCQLAENLGIPHASVESRLHQVCGKLRTALGEINSNEGPRTHGKGFGRS